jgi:hypothetical protein
LKSPDESSSVSLDPRVRAATEPRPAKSAPGRRPGRPWIFTIVERSVAAPAARKEVTMKRPLVLALLLTLCLGLTGCMQVVMNTNIKEDGSGTMFMSYSMSKDVADAMAQLQEMGPMQGMGDQSPPDFSDFNKADLEKECKKYGATLKSFKETDADGRKGMEMELEFKDLNALNGVMSGSMGGNGGGFGIFKMDDGNYILVGVEPTEDEDAEEDKPVETPPAQPDPAQMGKMMEVMGKLMGSISELNVTMRITVPGDVIKNNAPKVEGRTLIWEINSENMMSAGDQFGEPEIIFSGKGLKIDAPPYAGK